MDLKKEQQILLSKQRIKYIDALRGFTMFLVVLQHIESIGFGIHPYESVLGNILVSFRMPMFFFISGYIAYKVSFDWNMDAYCSNLRKKAIVQLIPTVFFFSLFTIAKAGNPISSFVTNGWGGYWFTFVLFEMFVLFYSLSYWYKKYLDHCLVALSVFGVFSLVVFRSDAAWWNMLCLENLCKYFQFFSLGILAKKYNTKFSFLIFIFSIVIITATNWVNESFIVKSLVRDVIVRYTGIFVVFAFFLSKEEFFKRENWFNKCILFIGRRTLDIYVIHYFLLSSFPQLKSFVQQNIITEISVSFFLTIMVIAVSLVISEVIRCSSFLGHYLFGVKLEKNDK